MHRSVLTLAFLPLLMSGVFAQDVANVGPVSTAALPSFDPVVGRCEEVSQNPEIADRESGICVTATRAYIASLSGLSPSAVDQKLADLVIELAVLPVGGVQCEEFDDEIAEAIRIASTASADSEQRAQFLEIAATVIDQCGAGRTAAIASTTPIFTSPDNNSSSN
jgi:hypothetical protein